GYELARMEEVDLFLGGHSHSKFPSEDYEDIEGINLEEATIHGTPAAKPLPYGQSLRQSPSPTRAGLGLWQSPQLPH
ncbi:MAG: hypothetical protein R6V26_05200, partial [Roseovarius sp.]